MVTEMDNRPRIELIEILAKHGPNVIEDSRRCRALLNDMSLGLFRREIAVLISAQENRSPEFIQARYKTLGLAEAIAQCTSRLCQAMPIEEEAARWAVESWAVALEVATDSDLAEIETNRISVQSTASSPSGSVSPQYDLSLPHTNTTEPEPAVASASAMVASGSPAAEKPKIWAYVSALLFLICLGLGRSGVSLQSELTNEKEALKQSTAALADARVEIYKKTQTTAQAAAEIQGQKKSLDQALALLHKHPLLIEGQGVFESIPNTSQFKDVPDSTLISPVTSIHVACKVGNNLYGIGDSHCEYTARLTYPDGRTITSDTQKHEISFSEEEQVLEAGWRYTPESGNKFPPGHYEYTFLLDGKQVAQGIFTITG